VDIDKRHATSGRLQAIHQQRLTTSPGDPWQGHENERDWDPKVEDESEHKQQPDWHRLSSAVFSSLMLTMVLRLLLLLLLLLLPALASTRPLDVKPAGSGC